MSGPTRTCPTASTSRATTCSCTSRCTSRRAPAEHTCPALVVNPVTDPATAASRSASAKMMFADFPPNSRVSGMIRSAAILPMARPVATEPVNATFATTGCCTRAAPAPCPVPSTTLSVPAGNPTSVASCASRTVVEEVLSDGLITTVLPAASAGAPRLVDRHVPRRDHADHSEGFAPGVDVLVGRHVEGLTGRHAHQAAVELEKGGGDVDLGEGDGLRFAGLADLEGDQ